MTESDLWRSLGTRGAQVGIVRHDPVWLRVFEREAELMLKACRPWITAVHHVGSTSVPGQAAKPVLDIVPVAGSPIECAKAVDQMR